MASLSEFDQASLPFRRVFSRFADPYPRKRSRCGYTLLCGVNSFCAWTIKTLPCPANTERDSKAQNLHPTLRQSLTTHESVSATAALASASHHTARFTSGPPEEAEDAARVAYENREIAANAIPLYEKPDDIIEGTRGIVRSVILNDRWHALTVDTRGQVGVWDITRGQCLGVFEREDVEAIMHGSSMEGCEYDERKWSPREALEAVRERIEGEAVVSSWCTVDSSIGNLMVHVQYPQCFDGEIYADEAGYGSERPVDEDARRKSCQHQ
jgi:WD repeat-containing protein 48